MEKKPAAERRLKKTTRSIGATIAPQGKVRPVGVILEDEAGNLFRTPAEFAPVARIGDSAQHSIQPSPIRTRGRPRKEMRDVSLTLHFEYLLGLKAKGTKIGSAQEEIAQMFNLKKADNVRAILQKTRTNILRGYPKIFASEGIAPNLHGRVLGCFLAAYRQLGDGRVEGYAVNWGTNEAHFGRGRFTRTVDGIGLELL